tara:strand:- start:141 stop:494 length:354 start_codon:yes stop_codon:yes gene_type:complete
MRWLILCLLLSGCGIMSWLPFGGSTGSTVNSNAQIGAENRQAVLSVEQTEEVTAGRDVITTEVLKEVETGMVEKLNIQNIPPWVMILLLLGWLLPTPTEMGRGMFNFVLLLFGRQKL